MNNGSSSASNKQVEEARKEIESMEDEELENTAKLAAEGEWTWACDIAGALREVIRLRKEVQTMRWDRD